MLEKMKELIADQLSVDADSITEASSFIAVIYHGWNRSDRLLHRPYRNDSLHLSAICHVRFLHMSQDLFSLYCNTPTPLSLLQARTQRPHSTQRFMS